MSIFEPTIPTDDQFARQEQTKYYKKSKRQSQSDGHKHIIRLAFIWLCAILVFAILITRVVYLIIPAHCWLSDDSASKLDEFLIHGTVGAIMVSVLKPVVFGKED